MDNGFIKLHRQITRWEWYTDLPTFKLFLHFLLKANHETTKWRGQVIERGSLVTSLPHLSRDTGLTIQQVRTAINRLKSTQEITQTATRRNTMISIKNWDEYQITNIKSNTQSTHNQHTNNIQITTNKKEKNEKNEKKKKEKERKFVGFVCNLDFEKTFKIYGENCQHLSPLTYERRSKAILDELRSFLEEIDYDYDYFSSLCRKADKLEKIVDRRIDFRSMIRNHIGIMNGKYAVKKESTPYPSWEETQRSIQERQTIQGDEMPESFKKLKLKLINGEKAQ